MCEYEETPFDHFEEHRVGEIVIGNSTKEFEEAWHHSWFKPRVDIFETDTHYVAEFETPGLRIEDLVLRATPHALSLSFIKHPKGVGVKGHRTQNERHFGNYFRRIEIPSNVDISKREAVYDNGVLKVCMPFKEL